METTLVERNPLTHEKHQREVFWQITFPLIIGLAFIAGLVALTIVTATQGGNVSQAADTSLIFLLIPAMVMAFIVLAILAALAYGIIWMNRNLPPYFKIAQDAMVRVSKGTISVADKLTDPIIRFRSMMASLEAFKRK